jgi:hypothetical protein
MPQPENAPSSTSAAEPEQGPQEIPPWAPHGQQEPLNMRTGRFGDTNTGRFQELSDGKFKVLPSAAAQRQFKLDVNLLPEEERNEVHRLTLLEEEAKAEAAAEESERMKAFKYRRWRKFLEKVKDKEVTGRSESSANVRPVGPKVRMSALLRAGRDRQPLQEADLKSFRTEL